MATSIITITHDESTADMQALIKAQTTNPKGEAVQLSNYFGALAGGLKAASLDVQVAEGDAVAASGTFTLDTVIATDAISINGVTFTAVASGATAVQFNVGADDEETATNLAAAINASANALVSGLVTAAAVDEVVTITAYKKGKMGNAVTIASADATIVASGARLTGGTNATAVTYSLGK
jgi:phage tail sheath gpL-like